VLGMRIQEVACAGAPEALLQDERGPGCALLRLPQKRRSTSSE